MKVGSSGFEPATFNLQPSKQWHKHQLKAGGSGFEPATCNLQPATFKSTKHRLNVGSSWVRTCNLQLYPHRSELDRDVRAFPQIVSRFFGSLLRHYRRPAPPSAPAILTSHSHMHGYLIVYDELSKYSPFPLDTILIPSYTLTETVTIPAIARRLKRTRWRKLLVCVSASAKTEKPPRNP